MSYPTVHIAGAQISACGAFRYRLWRVWSDERKLMFIGLNPSTADANVNDATVNWLIRWAYANGYGGLEICNLYAYRTSKPSELKASGYEVGVNNDAFIRSVAKFANTVVCGWGANAQPSRALEVIQDLERECIDLYRWGVNAAGSPKHPLYLPARVELEHWWSTHA